MNQVDRFMSSDFSVSTIEHLVQCFLLEREANGISLKTIERYFYNFQPLMEAMGTHAFIDLDRRWIENHMSQMRLQYALDSLRVMVADVKFFCRWAYERRHHTRNIGVGLSYIKKPKRRRDNLKAASEPDVIRLMNCLAGELLEAKLIYRDVFQNLRVVSPEKWHRKYRYILRDLFVVVFLYETGARAGELIQLGTRAMKEALLEDERAYLVIMTGKTHERERWFTKATAELWLCWQQVRPQYEPTDNYALIGWRKGRLPIPIQTNGISQMLVRRCTKYHIPVFRAQALRHAKVRRSRRTVGLQMAQELIDHSAVESTFGYSNISYNEMINAAFDTGLKVDLWKKEKEKEKDKK